MRDDQGARIAELERDNARLRQLLNVQNVPRTLRHQVRNSLGLMRAILRRSAETSVSVEDFTAHAEGRFDALLRIQNLLISAPADRVSLHSIISDEWVAHVIKEDERATIDGPPVMLESRAAQWLGLAFHELTVNAIKFGAMTTPKGHLSVSWRISEDAEPNLDLIWAETGLGGLAPPTYRGFGVEAVETMLRYEVGAESALAFLPEGLRCSIKLPLSRIQS